jgi:hypothetical protein
MLQFAVECREGGTCAGGKLAVWYEEQRPALVGETWRKCGTLCRCWMFRTAMGRMHKWVALARRQVMARHWHRVDLYVEVGGAVRQAHYL